MGGGERAGGARVVSSSVISPKEAAGRELPFPELSSMEMSLHHKGGPLPPPNPAAPSEVLPLPAIPCSLSGKPPPKPRVAQRGLRSFFLSKRIQNVAQEAAPGAGRGYASTAGREFLHQEHKALPLLDQKKHLGGRWVGPEVA